MRQNCEYNERKKRIEKRPSSQYLESLPRQKVKFFFSPIYYLNTLSHKKQTLQPAVRVLLLFFSFFLFINCFGNIDILSVSRTISLPTLWLTAALVGTQATISTPLFGYSRKTLLQHLCPFGQYEDHPAGSGDFLFSVCSRFCILDPPTSSSSSLHLKQRGLWSG